MKLSTAVASLLSVAAGLPAPSEASISAASIIEQIAPKSKQCSAELSDCRTASQAGPWIAKGMVRYGVYSTKEMAAILALIALESGEFQYKRNVYPGRPGQGTVNMQMPGYNLEYAKSIATIQDPILDNSSIDGMTDEQLNHILDLVVPDQYSFATGAWYLTTHCSDARPVLRQDIDAGWVQYMSCVGITEITEDRQAYFERAKQAFGLN